MPPRRCHFPQAWLENNNSVLKTEMQSHRRQLLAHVLPMVLFLALLGLYQFLTSRGQIFFLRHAEFWIYPAQTILCGALLLWFRRCYQFHRLKNVVFTLFIAVAVFGTWIAPQYFLNFAPRTVGFDPTLLESNSYLLVDDSFSFPSSCSRRSAAGRGFLARFPASLCYRRTFRASSIWQI